MRLRRVNLVSLTPIPPASRRQLPPAFVARIHPRKAIPKHALAFACQRGLSTRAMAMQFKCSQPHIVRQLAQHGLKTNAAVKKRWAAVMTTLDDETKIQISKVQAVTPRARPAAEHEGEVRHEASHRADHHSGRRASVRRMERKATRTPHMLIIMTLPPPHIQKYIELLQRVPRVGHRYRTRPLTRVARWFLRERERLAAESAMEGYRSALRCHRETGVGYRLARQVQDRRERGQRIGRGAAWDRTP